MMRMTFVLFLNCRSNKIVCFKSIFIVKMNWLNNKSLKKNYFLMASGAKLVHFNSVRCE